MKKGISSGDVDRFIREGVIINDGTGHLITNKSYNPASANLRQPTSEPEPEPESEPEADENEIEPETTYVRRPPRLAVTLENIPTVVKEQCEACFPAGTDVKKITDKTISSLDDYLEANHADYISINTIRAEIYLASNTLGHTLSQTELTRQTGASPAKLSACVKTLADFHGINVPFKVPRGIAAKTQQEPHKQSPDAEGIGTPEDTPKPEPEKSRLGALLKQPTQVGFNDIAAAAYLLDFTNKDALQRFVRC